VHLVSTSPPGEPLTSSGSAPPVGADHAVTNAAVENLRRRLVVPAPEGEVVWTVVDKPLEPLLGLTR
jgi:hypothetical protein